MTKRSKMIALGATTLALAGGGSAVAIAGGAGDGDGEENDAAEQVHGSSADKATAAALDAIPGGEANAVERDSENGATWEVEVTKPDGSTVDVRLDESYQVVVIEGDQEDTGAESDD